eukprot:Skav205390  [mRNA]  locus=scaffold1642:40459:42228:- [translate_table: standard]
MTHASEPVEAIMSVLHEPARTNANRPGPISVLLTRLHQVAWSWQEGTRFHDEKGHDIDVLQCPVQEVVQRLRESWQERVKCSVMHRQTFGGIQHASAALTVEAMQRLDPGDQAVLRTCLNGTFFTADHAKHSQPGASDRCPWCQEPDSQLHRHWFCPQFQVCRAIAADQVQELVDISPCMANHGWVPEPPSIRQFKITCSQQTLNMHFELPHVMPDHLHVFTDGGCKSPECPYSRYASWGVAVASHDFHTYHAVASGLLPGWIQTVLRAEIQAVVQACRFAMQVRRSLTLWIDNWVVYRKVCRIIQGSFKVKPNQTNADMWKLLQETLLRLHPLPVRVQHVYSHQSLEHATEAEIFAFRGNEVADHLATAELNAFSEQREQSLQVQRDLKQVRFLRDKVHHTLIQVGKAAIQQRPSQVPTEPSAASETTVPDDLPPLQVPAVHSADLSRRYQWEGMVEFFTWLQDLTHDNAPVAYVSYFQFNVLYEHSTRKLGVTYSKNRKQWQRTDVSLNLDFVKRSNNLVKYANGALTELGTPWKGTMLRPSSAAITFWAMCLPLQIKPSLLALADELLRQKQPTYASVGSLRTFSW